MGSHRLDDPEYPKLFKVIKKAIRTTAILNSLVTDELQEINEVVFSELIAKKLVHKKMLIFKPCFAKNVQYDENSKQIYFLGNPII